MKKRWCSTLWPTEALARQAGMPLADFGAFVARALFLDQPDPVALVGRACARSRTSSSRALTEARDAAHRGRRAPT